jgi:hypothetical protein
MMLPGGFEMSSGAAIEKAVPQVIWEPWVVAGSAAKSPSERILCRVFFMAGMIRKHHCGHLARWNSSDQGFLIVKIATK